MINNITLCSKPKQQSKVTRAQEVQIVRCKWGVPEKKNSWVQQLPKGEYQLARPGFHQIKVKESYNFLHTIWSFLEHSMRYSNILQGRVPTTSIMLMHFTSFRPAYLCKFKPLTEINRIQGKGAITSNEWHLLAPVQHYFHFGCLAEALCTQTWKQWYMFISEKVSK